MTTSTTSQQKNYLNNLLNGIAWPDLGLEWSENPKKPGILFKLLHALSFNDSRIEYLSADQVPEEIGMKLGYYWDLAHKNMKANKLSSAERALKNILKIDQYNAAVFNRLGIIAAKRKRYSDSINYFQKAVYCESSSSALHNLGLVYYEAEDYKKSVNAFKMALHLDHNRPERYIAFAKANEMLGNEKKVRQALEMAVRVKKSKMTLTLLYNFYKSRGMSVEEHQVFMKLTQIGNKNAIELDYNIESLKLSMELA